MSTLMSTLESTLSVFRLDKLSTLSVFRLDKLSTLDDERDPPRSVLALGLHRDVAALDGELQGALHRLGVNVRKLGEIVVAREAGEIVRLGIQAAGDGVHNAGRRTHHLRVVKNLVEPLTSAASEIFSLRRGILVALARGIVYSLHCVNLRPAPVTLEVSLWSCGEPRIRARAWTELSRPNIHEICRRPPTSSSTLRVGGVCCALLSVSKSRRNPNSALYP
jgi:hypothetical protein